jgi:SAM-dependent methyltransferase
MKITDAKVIILANAAGGFPGGSTRWNNHLGINKHLVPIGNMPLIHYIQNQLKYYGFSDIVISCQEKDKGTYIINNNQWISPPDLTGNINPDHEIMICESVFDRKKNNIILYGDNFYSKEFFNKIMSADPEDWWFYGREGASDYVGKPYTEDFGWYIPPKFLKFLIRSTYIASEDMIKHHGQVIPGIAIHQTYEFSINMQNKKDFYCNWINVDDETTDFDYPAEWDYWSKEVLPEIPLMNFEWEKVWGLRKKPEVTGEESIDKLINISLGLDGFDQTTGDGLASENLSNFVNEWSNIVKVKNKDVIYEIGCGSGAFLASIGKIYDVGLFGIDYSSSLVEAGKSLFKNINFEHKEASIAVYPDDVSHIVSFSVFEYFPTLHYAESVLNNAIRSNAKTISVFDIPNIEFINESEKDREDKIGSHRYKQEYLSSGLSHTYYSKMWFSNIFGDTWNIVFQDNAIDGYLNSKYRFNLIATRS